MMNSKPLDSCIIGEKLLGPIMYEFCHRLYIAALVAAKHGNGALLFMSRGGMRLRVFYELYLEKNMLESPLPLHWFWTSRFAAIKMTFQDCPDYSLDCLAREFANTPIPEAAQALLPNCAPLLHTIPNELSKVHASKDNLQALFSGDSAYSQALRKHFQEQYALGHTYMSQEFGSYQNLYLVDSGWFGSTLGSLICSCPEWNFRGLFFGRWNYRNYTPWYWNYITGLFLDAQGFAPGGLENTLIEYHHLIESPLEPPLPSAEYYIPGSAICNAAIPHWEHLVRNSGMNDDFYRGILKYMQQKQGKEYSQLRRETDQALKRLRRLIRYPSKTEYSALVVPDRSADFGKHILAPVLNREKPATAAEAREMVMKSLWGPGEIARVSGPFYRLWQLGFTLGKRHRLPRKLLGKYYHA